MSVGRAQVGACVVARLKRGQYEHPFGVRAFGAAYRGFRLRTHSTPGY